MGFSTSFLLFVFSIFFFRWEFELKTAVANGLLLYNTGVSSRSDYVGVEIMEKHLRLLVDKGNGPTELISDATIADGEWHAVVVHFSPNFMEISIDRRSSTLQLPPGGNRFLDLGDILFIGEFCTGAFNRVRGFFFPTLFPLFLFFDNPVCF